MVKIANGWREYKIIATGGGKKLEKWGELIMLRPDPQIIWKEKFKLSSFKGINAVYSRSDTGGGCWEIRNGVPDNFIMERKGLKFNCKLMGFKHLGLFPEQAVNWDVIISLIEKADRPLKVLNLFAYTGGATLAAACAGAHVTHVDSAKAMVDRAKSNCRLSGIDSANTRFIVDDCVKFVEKEIRRGVSYDAVIMDPPSYGRGANGETWKIERDLCMLVELCTRVLSRQPLFFLINSYTTGLQPTVIGNVLSIALSSYKGRCEAYELALPTEESIPLPCGASGLYVF